MRARARWVFCSSRCLAGLRDRKIVLLLEGCGIKRKRAGVAEVRGSGKGARRWPSDRGARGPPQPSAKRVWSGVPRFAKSALGAS